ncbi:MAG TPA: peptide-methionine (S)-S-oxide reductase MsrA [Polyangiaceae bacterium]|jgi:peptide-methionine (S)-S-oxide reductase|nr:peptide-methionine (S)-S-oxide reductase MsrA [Polyangiaceae bacterium]
MNRTLRYALFSLAISGCQAAGAEEMGKPGATVPKAARVGTDPGKVGDGTPLTPQAGHELAAFAGGCFWGVEDAFRKVPGVTATAVGFTGGHTKNPTYPKVCEHDTGHAETVLVEFDPAKITYDKLLMVFFKIHDPTTLNSQGPDYGDQYRSAIFTFSPKQAASAAKAVTATQNQIHEKVVTVVAPIAQFWKAEGYHQQYAERTGTHGCPVRGFTGVI